MNLLNIEMREKGGRGWGGRGGERDKRDCSMIKTQSIIAGFEDGGWGHQPRSVGGLTPGR